LEAGLLEFSYHDRNSASVNTIVRIADISKGSFYQYFEDKDEFYWYVVMELVLGKVTTYETLLKRYGGDFLKAEEVLFTKLLDLFDDTKTKNLLTNVYASSYVELLDRLSDRGSTIYFKMYDLLMEFGFKGYNIQSKEEFLLVFDLLRGITNGTILTMIRDGLSKRDTMERYHKQIEVLSNGIRKKRWF
jgi:AcrR family transcriptional regulator